MNNFWLRKGLKMAVLAALYIVSLGTFVRILWNWLMPNLFNLPMITFSQALGLFILARVLMGSFNIAGMSSLSDHKEKYEQKKQICAKLEGMTPEDRERWRDEWREKCRSRSLIGFHKKEKDEDPKKHDMI